MRIYKVVALLPYDPEDAEGATDEELQPQYAKIAFYLGADDLMGAFILAQEHMDAAFEDIDYEIITVKVLKDKGQEVQIANWGEEQECNCPYCLANRVAPEDVLTFNCKCGQEIKVADGWDQIICSNEKCGKVISRDKLIEDGKGGYFLADVG